MNYQRQIPILIPSDATALKATSYGILVYQAKEDDKNLGISKGKMYWVDQDGKHFSFAGSNYPVILWTSADNIIIHDTTASALGSGIGSKFIEPNDITTHTVYKIEMRVFISIDGEHPDDVSFRLKLGGETLVNATLFGVNVPGLDNEPMSAIFYLGIASTGSSGSVVATAEYHTGVYYLNVTGTDVLGSPVPIPVDLSTRKEIDIEVTADDGSTWNTSIATITKMN
jgi:hypothetical protein